MRELESRFEKELVVIGVASGKFHAERVTDRIRDASIRLRAVHPILNDRQFRTWRSYAVSAWPTLVAVDAAGYVVGGHAGEFTAGMLVPFIEGLITRARSTNILNDTPLVFDRDESSRSQGELAYPGKIAVDGARVAIADSAHHRVLIGRIAGKPDIIRIEKVAGSGKPGHVDGETPQFNSPQGMVFAGNRLYVADSENHAIRSIDIASGNVSTVAGTGRQLRTRADRDSGALSSPWDVAIHGETLFVAMAGVHQIWSIDPSTGSARVHAGTGGEDIRDADNREALLAQPMGIVAHGGGLFFADSESSAIRWSDARAGGRVMTIVGTGLFDFGDADGKGDDARLQHPQGVAVAVNGEIVVADSYNDALKFVDPRTRVVRTWIRGLNEPSGVACSSSHVYVADTNSHRIVAVELSSGEMSEVRFE